VSHADNLIGGSLNPDEPVQCRFGRPEQSNRKGEAENGDASVRLLFLYLVKISSRAQRAGESGKEVRRDCCEAEALVSTVDFERRAEWFAVGCKERALLHRSGELRKPLPCDGHGATA
jgi:hypothetical protein